MSVDPSKGGAFGRMKNGLPPCAGKAGTVKSTADGFTSKTQKEGCSQKRALKKGWKRPGFTVNREGTLENKGRQAMGTAIYLENS